MRPAPPPPFPSLMTGSAGSDSMTCSRSSAVSSAAAAVAPSALRGVSRTLASVSVETMRFIGMGERRDGYRKPWGRLFQSRYSLFSSVWSAVKREKQHASKQDGCCYQLLKCVQEQCADAEGR